MLSLLLFTNAIDEATKIVGKDKSHEILHADGLVFWPFNECIEKNFAV